MQIAIDYELLDSGDGAKLERFGSIIVDRPSSICLWKKRLPLEKWSEANAKYDPNLGWTTRRWPEKQWSIDTKHSYTLILKLQENGQIGVFPEHSLYLNLLCNALKTLHDRLNRPARVLNLFAYTGLASLACLKQGSEVTHVDLAKTAISWTKDNISANGLLSSPIRLIAEDALLFCAREIRRNNHYDLIIADPPNFSRISKNKSWAVEEILAALIGNLLSLLNDDFGYIFLTAHGLFGSAELCANLCYDLCDTSSIVVQKEALNLKESGGLREIPAGSLMILERK